MYRGRFAPSPTGRIHLGTAASALFAFVAARHAGGAIVLRVEDLDTPRVVADSEAHILDDLAWLGLKFDEGPREGGPHAPYRQSERIGLYRAAIQRLADMGLTYRCDCSRAEIARAASAPHPGDEGPRYPGTCRPFGMKERGFRRPPCVRFAIPSGEVRYIDSAKGERISRPSEEIGDFVLQRGDGVFSYQLAVVVDDLAMGITQIVRGADLESSAGRQALLMRLLGGAVPSYLHVPMLVESTSGERLAKRHGSLAIADLRSRGVSPATILRGLARAYGHPILPRNPEEILDALAKTFNPGAFPSGAVPHGSVEVIS